MLLHKHIKILRKASGLTQVEFSKRVGIGLRCLREMEQGKPTIRLDVICRVLDFLGYKLSITRGHSVTLLNSYSYPVRFNKELKLKVRKRDGFKCQGCHKLQLDLSESLNIHHIDYNKSNCNESNLISLCDKCHAITNADRIYWALYYKSIIIYFYK